MANKKEPVVITIPRDGDTNIEVKRAGIFFGGQSPEATHKELDDVVAAVERVEKFKKEADKFISAVKRGHEVLYSVNFENQFDTDVVVTVGCQEFRLTELKAIHAASRKVRG